VTGRHGDDGYPTDLPRCSMVPDVRVSARKRYLSATPVRAIDALPRSTIPSPSDSRPAPCASQVMQLPGGYLIVASNASRHMGSKRIGLLHGNAAPKPRAKASLQVHRPPPPGECRQGPWQGPTLACPSCQISSMDPHEAYPCGASCGSMGRDPPPNPVAPRAVQPGVDEGNAFSFEGSKVGDRARMPETGSQFCGCRTRK